MTKRSPKAAVRTLTVDQLTAARGGDGTTTTTTAPRDSVSGNSTGKRQYEPLLG